MGLYLQGRHDEAVDAARGTLELTPDNLEALVVLAAAQSASGRAAEARATRQEILRIKTDFAVDDFNTEVTAEVAYTSLRSVERVSGATYLESQILRRIEGHWRVDRFTSTPER